jgi:P-type Ca2+ transporter type 2C
MKKWYQLSAEEVLKDLNSNKNGLSSIEVGKRIAEYGYNEIPEIHQKHWIWILLKQYKSLLVYILLAAAVISWLTGHTVDVYVILAVIVINSLIGFIQEIRAERAVASLKSMLVPQAKVIRDGEKRNIQARELVPGDIIVLEEGDSIPADARIIESKNLRAIEAPLTGESVPVNKENVVFETDIVLADRKNMLFKSTFIAGGYAIAVVTGTGMDTAIGEIAQTLGEIKITKTNFQLKTDKLAGQMAVLAIISALLLFIITYFVGNAAIEDVLLISIAALVSAIPEGLPAVLAIVLAIGANRMAKKNAIIREFTATETLGAVTTIITDKTGTLTQNTLTVRKIAVFTDSEWNVTGEGWQPIGNFTKQGHVDDISENKAISQLLQIAAFSNNSDIRHDKEKDQYQLIGDPTEGALLVLARKGNVFPPKDTSTQKLDDLPFNSTLKMRATLVAQNGKKQLLIVGAPEKVFEKSKYILSEKGTEIFTEDKQQLVKNKIENWSGDAMRVIALAYIDNFEKDTIDESDFENLTFSGIVGMIDPPRPDVKEAVALCKQAGIRVIMATGDHINTAISVAKATGILDNYSNGKNIALTEKQLLALDEREFEAAILNTDVFARLTPNMKLKIAETLQNRGELIAMTGDGVNDAPALKKADVGIAMGIMGTDVARDSAKVVLADDNFSTIVSAVEEGRIVFINARQTSFFLVTTNFAEIITLITSVIIGIPLPLTATQILWLNLVTDGVGDISLATESGHGDVLKEKPLKPTENILNKDILPFLFINAILMTVLTLGVFQYFLPVSLEKARSAAFIMMAFTQLYNIFNMRSLKQSVFKIGIFSNKYINLALLVSLLIQIMIIEIPFFERLFQFDPISFVEFTILGLLASMVLWIGEIYKFLRYSSK